MFLPLHDTNALNKVRVQYVTLALIIINVAIWVFFGTATLNGSSEVEKAFISWGYIPAVANGYKNLPDQYVILPAYASYITYSFFHSGFMHLAGNMLFLWVFGDNVEDAMGHFRFLLFYLLCAAAGAFAHGLVKPESAAPLVGASGAAAGVVGAYLLLHPNVRIWVLALGKIPLRLSAFWVLGAWIGFQIFNLLVNSQSNVSWAAHVGGFAAGAVLILFMRSKGVPLLSNDLNGRLDLKKEEAAATQSVPHTRTVERPKANPNRKWGRGE